MWPQEIKGMTTTPFLKVLELQESILYTFLREQSLQSARCVVSDFLC